MTQASALYQNEPTPPDNTVYRLIRQIQDLESMQRDIEIHYEFETRTLTLANFERKPFGDSARLDRALIDRVFICLAGTPEYDRFVKIYGELVLTPSYQQVHSADLFGEYMRLIESAQTRVTTQLIGLLKSVAPDYKTP